MSVSQEQCSTHPDNLLEIFCSTCKMSSCKDCKNILICYQGKHDVIPMNTALQRFNQNASEVIKIAEGIKTKLEGTFDSIFESKSNFESHLKLCKTAIELQERAIIEKVREKSKVLIAELENLHEENKEAIDGEVKHLDVMHDQVKSLITSVNKIMNKPKEQDSLTSHKASIIAVRDKVMATNTDESFNKKNIIPNFILSTHLNELVNRESIGEIITVNDQYKVGAEDESFAVTRGQPFEVTVSSPINTDTCELAAILLNPSGDESSADVEYQGSGEYRITGRCNAEGDWQIKITTGDAHIKGSPVNIKVEKSGLIHTIHNISNYKEHNKIYNVSDVELDKDGCLLVASRSKDVLKFDRFFSNVSTIEVPQEVTVNRMHQMGDGHMMYSDRTNNCIVICDDEFNEIRSFGNNVFRQPLGMAMNKESRVVYVADCEAHCVFKFNDDGTLLGKLGSKGKHDGQMNKPFDVTLTKKGNVIVADYDNNRIQMFDANDNFMRRLVGYGSQDGKVICPCGVAMDTGEHLIVSSYGKLQLFDKNGDFIKRIDNVDDELDVPCGIAVISNRPRRVAVANHKANNVKIFNY